MNKHALMEEAIGYRGLANKYVHKAKNSNDVKEVQQLLTLSNHYMELYLLRKLEANAKLFS